MDTVSRSSPLRTLVCLSMTILSTALCPAAPPLPGYMNPLAVSAPTINPMTSNEGTPMSAILLARIPVHGSLSLTLKAAWVPSHEAEDAGSYIGNEWRILLFDSTITFVTRDKLTVTGPAGSTQDFKNSGNGKFRGSHTERWAELIEGVDGGVLCHYQQGIVFRYEDLLLRSITFPAVDDQPEEIIDLNYATPLQPGGLTRRSDGEAILTYTLQPTNEEGMVSELTWGDHTLGFFTSDKDETFKGYRRNLGGAQLVKIEQNGEPLISVTYGHTDGKDEGILAPADGLNRVDITIDQALNAKLGKEAGARGSFMQKRNIAYHPITEEIYWSMGMPFFLQLTKNLSQTVRIMPDGKPFYWEKRWVKNRWELLNMKTDGTATVRVRAHRKIVRTLKGCRVELDQEKRTFQFFPGVE